MHEFLPPIFTAILITFLLEKIKLQQSTKVGYRREPNFV